MQLKTHVMNTQSSFRIKVLWKLLKSLECGHSPADHFVAVIFLSEEFEGWLNDSTTQTKYQVEGWLLLDVVVAQGSELLKKKGK